MTASRRFFRHWRRLPSVEVLRLEDGDDILIEYDGPMTRDAVERIRGQVEEQFPGHRAIVLNRLSLKIVRHEHAEQ